MSQDSNTDFVQFDPQGDSTVLRLPLSIEQANEFIGEFVQGLAPDASMLDEIHILISPEAIARVRDSFPIPDEALIEK